jgi:Rrf2 family protein
MLSKKTRYSLLALTYLAREYGKGTVMISDIARSQIIPQRFLESILLELKRLGILGSKTGKSGGYYLIRKPEEVRLAEVIRHFEGAIALLPCVSEKYYESCEHCQNEELCSIRKVFKTIRDTTYQILQATSLADLINGSMPEPL